MILDCCYAAQAGRDRDNRIIELLAASGVNKRTPPAGCYSFTSIIMTVMRRMLSEREYLTVKELYTRLVRQVEHDEKVQETPVYISLNGREESISLRPRKSSNGAKDLLGDKALAVLSITISLSQKPDRPALRRLQRWLKAAAPRSISAITVDRILLQTEQIQDFLQQRGEPGLTNTIAKDLEHRKQLETLTLQPSAIETADLDRSRGARAIRAQSIIESLEAWTDRVYQSMQSNLLLNRDFCSDRELEQLQFSEPAKALGLSDSARLSLLNNKLKASSDFPDVRAVSRASIKLDTTSGDLEKQCYGRMADDTVIIEYRGYAKADERAKVVSTVKRLARLLKEAHDPAFHVAPFVGYTDEPLNDRFGLVFRAPDRIPSDGRRHISLHEAYSDPKRMSLNTRFKIGTALVRALSALHAVGWVHKSLRSENILFFANAEHSPEGYSSSHTDARFDFSQPRIFGFDLSRPEDVSSVKTKEYRRSRQVYMHPKRWGRPAEVFDKVHDIYALGVILLEIGCWRSVSQLDKMGKNFEQVNDEEQIRKELLNVAEDMLPHMAGEMYCQAVVACLGGAFDDYSKHERGASELHKAFASIVLDALVRGANAL